jgi:NADH-ubiquinone oxidoreductase chain 3
MINLVTTYQEKYSIFECGFHSFLGQNRTQFGVKFFIFAIVYLVLDLEIVLIFPYAASGYENGIYGLILTSGFIVIITLGFVFELGKQALRIDSKQTSSINSLRSNNQCFPTISKINYRLFSTTNRLKADELPRPRFGLNPQNANSYLRDENKSNLKND